VKHISKRVKYWYVQKAHVIIATTQRAASAAMAESVGTNGRQINKGAVGAMRDDDDIPIVTWIRDPYDRLACAYPIFSRQPPFLPRDANDYAEYCMSHTNPHFSPQVDLHTAFPHGYLPTRVYAFEQLKETWPIEVPGIPLLHIGAQPNRPDWKELEDKMDPDILARVRAHWYIDELMHNAALATPGECVGKVMEMQGKALARVHSLLRPV